MIGKTISRYTLVEKLGAGGMGEVYLAADTELDRRVAIKFLPPGFGVNADMLERFRREAKAAAALSHPNIVTVHDVGAHEGRPYIVMEYVDGAPLSKVIERKDLTLDRALEIATQILEALAAAHGAGVIHRDVKPDNIVVDGTGRVRLVDFGLARLRGAVTVTAEDSTIGTVNYMSPEQARGEKVDARTDLFSAGVVLYEMITGRRPFDREHPAAVLYAIMTEEPQPLRRYHNEASNELERIVTTLLAKDRERRYPGAKAVLPDLRRERVAAASSTESVSRGTGAGLRTGRAPWRTKRWLVALPAALVFVAAVVFALRITDRAPDFVPGVTTRVTLDSGLEIDPALSPDGEMIAYAAGKRGQMQIYVRRLSGGRTIALTADTTSNHRWPRWTRDGAQVAFQADSSILMVPALGGEPRRLLRLAGSPAGFDLSPDGTHIAYAQVTDPLRGSELHVHNLASGVDTVVDSSASDVHSVAWSPDGSRLAYVVGNGGFNAYNLGNEANSAVRIAWSDGSHAVEVSGDRSLNVSPVWAPDSRTLFWVSDREGPRDIYCVRLARSGEPDGSVVRVTTGLNPMGVSLDRTGNRLAYNTWAHHRNIWSVEIPRSAPISIARARPVTTGNQIIENLDVSHDGRWLVFDSDRGGNFDIYKMPARGGAIVQVTTDPGKDFQPQWSPDGRSIAFHSMRAGNRDVFTIASDGSDEVQRTSGPEEERVADWSADGKVLSCYVTSSNAILLRILPVDGNGRPRDFPIPGLRSRAYWSPTDRDLICYTSAQGLEVLNVATGERRVLSPVLAEPGIWDPDGRTIYFISISEGLIRSISSVPVDGGPSKRLVNFDDPRLQGISYVGIATDGRVFYLTVASNQSDVWVMDIDRR